VSGIAGRIADWAASVRYEDVPERVLARARLQSASVLGAVLAGASSDLATRVRKAAGRWGSGDQSTLIPGGERVPSHTACYVNAAASVAFDFDDYLFAGHTGHSSVLGAIAYGEATGANGRDVLAAQVVGNEVGGRLGAAFLLGPHNGQMWTYIHALEGACVAGRLLGLDATQIRHAIGIALAQPPYPLSPAFFGPDSKALLVSAPFVEGVRAAELAAEGLTGAEDIIGDENGMLRKIGVQPLAFVFSGLGSAWVTDSLAYKLYPGCAYVDTPVDALEEIRTAFAEKHGRPLGADDVARVHVAGTMFTAGMEAMATPYRNRDRLTPVDVNFSVGLSYGVLLVLGEISPATLAHDVLEKNREAILAVYDRVTVEQDAELTMQVGGLGDLGIDAAQIFSNPDALTLDGADFGAFQMRFPSRVTLETSAGDEFSAEVSIPAGAPGRPLDEIEHAVRDKFLRGAKGVIPDPEAALDAVLAIDSAPDLRATVALLTQR
jgi:2-methylcitrate dehydratase PrpD